MEILAQEAYNNIFIENFDKIKKYKKYVEIEGKKRNLLSKNKKNSVK